MSKPLIYSIKDFRQTMLTDIYKSGIARIEHFDNIVGQLRQWGTAYASTVSAYGSSNTGSAINSFQKIGTTLYALGIDSGTNHPAIYKWDYNTQSFLGHTTFATGSAANCLFSYKGILYGYYNGTDVFTSPTGGGNTPTYSTFAAPYTHFAYPIVHSKDNVAYLFTDNLVSTFAGTAAAPVTALTLPTNFRITAACEDGDYIMIVGYNTDGKATGYLWDRDSSLATTTAKYDLGVDIPHHVAKLGGTLFIVSARGDSTDASGATDQSVLTIRVRNGDRADILPNGEYQMTSLAMPNNSGNSYEGRYATSHRLYFTARAQLKGDSAAKSLVFRLDYDGRLTIALNVGVNSTNSNPPLMSGVIRDGDSWWVGGKGDGNWTTSKASTDYTTTSSFETSIIRSEDLTENVQFRDATVTFESLPAGGSISVLARKNEETAWTTLKTYSTSAKMKFNVTALEAVNALNGLDRAKQFQCRLQVTSSTANSPVIVTGFQVEALPVPDQGNG